MLDDPLFQLATGAVYGLIQLLIIAAAIILVLKKQSLSSILMLVGAILSGFLQILTPIIYRYYTGEPDNFLSLNFLMNIISVSFYTLFGLGFLLFAINFKKP